MLLIFPSIYQCKTLRFYLGLALAQQTEGAGKRKEEAMGYISEGLEYMLSYGPEEEKHEFLASKPIKPSNIHCLQAFLIMADQGKYLKTIMIIM